ncbi:toll/interleukin-1 receptor domain-containing protein [Vreelandella titanicae]|uniref:toll/interleukin-1 receptor domain-containing protein n=1 Tax=Vreelandella titanicae TaxID=664683 RepID=UPI00241DE1AD|nr:toll/interleukin-1 receptor domain-containing protein [Halomonas titanicae]
MTNRTQVFVSYSHADSEHLLRLKVHLRPYERKGQVDLWADTKIKPGQKWRSEIESALDRAAVAVLLVSADFLASDFVVENELPPLLEAAQAEGVKILPVILKPCAFGPTKEISQFQAINSPSAPLISLDEGESEAVWVKLAEEVSESVEEFSRINEEKQEVAIPLFGQFGWATELLQSEIRDPSVLQDYDVYEYQHIDCLEYMPSAEAVLQGVRNRNDILEAAHRRFSASGWEGDGELQIMWLPPFIGAGIEDTWGLAVWFVKQSNNGTAFLASPVSLPFARLLDQQL